MNLSCELCLFVRVLEVCLCFSALEQLPAGPGAVVTGATVLNCVPCSCTDPCVTATPVVWPCVD